ncbi:MAG: D-alanyl-D-alanine carboxypeptidase, partial [Cyanobacteria bacterium]|nr:D-alanyl-D-alanine carboxypeptidase [Cyanobacteriota bacterium]
MVMMSPAQPQAPRQQRPLVAALALGFTLLPSAPALAALPQLQNQVSCAALQQRVQASLGTEASVWSVSVADGSGRLLADVNGLQPRVPASNQKLVSTAFALDR